MVSKYTDPLESYLRQEFAWEESTLANNNWLSAQNKTQRDSWSNVKLFFCFTSKYHKSSLQPTFSIKPPPLPPLFIKTKYDRSYLWIATVTLHADFVILHAVNSWDESSHLFLIFGHLLHVLWAFPLNQILIVLKSGHSTPFCYILKISSPLR